MHVRKPIFRRTVEFGIAGQAHLAVGLAHEAVRYSRRTAFGQVAVGSDHAMLGIECGGIRRAGVEFRPSELVDPRDIRLELKAVCHV